MNSLPMKAIQYFCVAARTLSFKDAAEQLAVTPGAVSQQIKLLENWLGVQLFERETRAIRLTSLGNSYFKRIEPRMQEVIGVTHSMRQMSRSRAVQLAVPPAFEVLCLVPKLPEILQRFPNIDLRTKASPMPTALREDGTEMAIRYMTVPDPKLTCYKLTDLIMTPMVSPDLLVNHPEATAGDYSKLTLIHDILHPDWHLFYDRMGIDAEQIKTFHCDQSLVSLTLAEQGMGVALADDLLAGHALKNGRLVPLIDWRVTARRALYLVHSAEQPLSPQALMIRDWVLETYGQDH